MGDSEPQPDPSTEQWGDAAEELGRLLQQHLMPAIQPILDNVGEEVARAMRQQLHPGEESEKQPERQPEERAEPPPRQIPPSPEAQRPREPVLAEEVRPRQGPERRPPSGRTSRTQYARIMTTTAMPGLVLNAPDTVKLWQDRLADIFKSADGFLGAYVLGNPGSTTGITITLWESEQAARDSDALEQIIPEIQPYILGEPNLEGYEIIYSL